MERKIYTPVLLIAIAVFVLFSAFRKNEHPVRQVWEYKLVYESRSVGDEKWVNYVDNVETSTGLYTIIKGLGDQGWELVSTVPVSSAYSNGYANGNGEYATVNTTPSYAGYTNQVYYWFRRPKQ